MVNHKRPPTIYNELGLQLRNKAPKRRVKAFSRFSPTLDARFSYRSEGVVATLDRACG